MREQNVRDFPLAKLDSEIKSRFLLNEHGDPHFLMQKLNFTRLSSTYISIWRKYSDFIDVKNTSLGSAGYVRTQRILQFVVLYYM